MRIQQLFTSFVEKSLERVPLLEIREERVVEGVDGALTNTISQNIFTAFDASLSRHMSAIKGEGLSAISVVSKFARGGDPLLACPVATEHYVSLPHALKAIAKDAIDSGGNAVLEIVEMPAETGVSQKRVVGPEDLLSLEKALKVAEWFGQPEFVPLSGDFDMVVLEPMGSVRRVVIDLYKGSVSIIGDKERFEAPLFGFAEHVRDHPSLRSLLAAARHSQIEAKQEAVLDFREKAEQRILGFDRALRGNELEYHRLHAAMSLVARLRVGLGDDLSGLSEDAQITALDWSAVIERSARNKPQDGGAMLKNMPKGERMRA
ncbi:hypothetical protein KHP62_04570 [Rhodobacteraceae bacterium NNCM2]|nr:hypothetical protein [Coraliihabitans acroporae]